VINKWQDLSSTGHTFSRDLFFINMRRLTSGGRHSKFAPKHYQKSINSPSHMRRPDLSESLIMFTPARDIAHTMGLVANTIGLAALLEDGQS
jgi:hypothetical protein